jgi:hypothetical protein
MSKLATSMRHKSATNEAPEVSVVMAVFNTDRYVGQAIGSILAQKEVNFEIVAVNDASTDDSLSCLLNVDDDRLTILSMPQNAGLYCARNEAIKECRAPWVMIFDSDDIMLPDTFGEYFRATEASSCSWGYCGLDFMDSTGQSLGVQMGMSFDPLKMLHCNMIPDPMSLMKRDILSDIGCYRTRFRLSEDYLLKLRLIERSDPFYYPRICVRYRRHKESVTVVSRDHGMDVLQEWRAGLLARSTSGRQFARVERLNKCFVLLDAFTGGRWDDVVAVADELISAGLVSVELEQRLIFALIKRGNTRRALEIVLSRLASSDVELLPAETAWLMARAVSLTAATGTDALLRSILSCAENICTSLNDKDLDYEIRKVRAGSRYGACFTADRNKAFVPA